ncbi:MAG: 30S ribosomal protein S2 [Bacteroidetes bacterium]|nr:MAG: 30S ribosomal protein S2 [Bacteroidota bacterium]REK03552.1 MAG: 30S ribosomal protein S2 [Bacteroidota bacterium]REK34622.1 MAG: 30S ribosomal protein S2 [Bacteroidota bacterium]
MSRVSYNDLLEAGAHFGHLKSKWNPKMAPYIFMEARGIHIIDLNKTVAKLEEAANAIKQVARSGKKVLFVATKKQAKDIVADAANRVGMPYIVERWPGGMLTNFATVRKSVKKMAGFDKMATDGTFAIISKKERLQITRQKAKMEKFLGSIVDLGKLPAALFIVDINKEHIAVAEAKKLNIPTFAITDTNTDPTQVDFAVPANDDATKSIALIVDTMAKAIEEGLAERKLDKEAEKDREEEGTTADGGINVEYVGKDEAGADEDTDSVQTAKKPGRKRTTTAKKN